ncbi:MAG: DUF3500 domain-containing protein, partial [Planctomycetota bacterium]
MIAKPRICPDCGEAVTRRDFLKGAAGAAAAAALGVSAARAAALSDASPEELVKRLYESLTPKQREAVCLSWDHANRTRVGNNWAIVKPTIGGFFTPEQQQILRDIFRGLVTEDGYERFQKQMRDDYGGFENYHVAIFGDPTSGRFNWVMTGRHLTIRCDGNSTEGAGFGGPIFYGHAVEFNERPDHPGNVFWHQARLANKVFESLDGRQREKALLEKSPPDDAKSIALRPPGPEDGLCAAELSRDQKELVDKVLKELLAPYRASDVEEALGIIREGGGV